MKPEKELLTESLVDLHREMNKQKDISQIVLRARGFVSKFNEYLATAKKLYADNPAITTISETQPVSPGGIAQLPHLSTVAPEKYDDTKLKIKQILNVLGVDPSAPIPSNILAKAPTKQAISRICDRFDLVAKQLSRRHGNRDTLAINDEYDLQDLLHSLLVLFFNDVRPEEYTPSYAGSSRMDFLLKEEQTVIEAKYDLPNKATAEQLAIDIAKYRTHPDCKTLVCFVYDPKSQIQNPRGLENDLGKSSTTELQVSVFVRP